MNTKYLLLGLTILAISSMVFISCSEEETETNKEYVGEWHTAVYDNLTGIKEQMEVTMTNTTFEDVVFQGTTESNLVEATAVQGSISFIEDGKFKVVISDIKVGSGTSWINKESSSTQFYTYFNAGIGQIMLEEFTANYELVDANSLRLIIPVTYGTDTLNLTK